MKKKTEKELGYLITDGMIDTIGNKDLTDAQVGMFIRSVISGNAEYAKKDMLVKALVTAFADQFKMANKRRSEAIVHRRQGNREREQRRREAAKIAHEKIMKLAETCEDMSAHVGTCDNMSAHVRTCATREGKLGKVYTPYNPPAGDEKTSSAKADAPNGKTNTGPDRRKHGRIRPAAAKKKKAAAAGRGEEDSKRTTASGQGTEAVVAAAERMRAAHPNSKSSLRAVVRALRNCDDAAAVEASHTAWCGTDGWAPEKGQFVQSLAAWIANGGWTKPPPEKKPAREKAGRDEGMSFDASL